jgi:hypothetical protein
MIINYLHKYTDFKLFFLKKCKNNAHFSSGNELQTIREPQHKQ